MDPGRRSEITAELQWWNKADNTATNAMKSVATQEQDDLG